MDLTQDAQILAAERLKEGVVIRFEDGRCAFYSAALLSALFPKATELDESKTAW